MPDRAKDETFRFFVEQIKDHAVFMIGPDGRNLTWNEGVRRVFGYDEAEWIGMPSADVFTPRDQARGIPAQELEEAARRGTGDDDRWMCRKGGEVFWASGMASVLRDDEGKLTGYVKVVRDLTGTKRLEEALRAQEERFRLALEAASMGAFCKPEGKPFETSEGVSQLFGLPSSETIEMTELLAHVHSQDREAVESAFRRAYADGRDLRLELRVAAPAGAPRWLALSGRRFTPNGEKPYLSGVFLDITERKRSEERFIEAQRMDAVGQLAGGVAHELNNMLTAILGFTDLILWETTPTDVRRADLEQVHQAATRAATITAQLLAFGRRQVLQPRLIDLNAAVRPLEPVLRHVLGEDKQLETHYAEDLGPVLVDPGQIEQVILNLVLNARDALDAGGRVVISSYAEEISAGEALARPGDSVFPLRNTPPIVGRAVILRVEDDGHGMDAQTRARAFEPFFTTKAVGQGTGLGLSTVLGIVQQSGGAIRLTTSAGRGTTFELFFPEVTGEAPSVNMPEGHALAPFRETVLVVEDEGMVRSVACRYLAAAGYRCLEAADGVEALEVFEREEKDIALVLTDLVMPRMGGRELAEKLTGMKRGLPVLFVTGYAAGDAARREAIPAGQPVLQKPFTPAHLIAEVSALLDR